MPLNKWHYIFKSASDGKCPLEVAWHLWTPVQAGESSLTGQACRTMRRASGKLPATPEKVAALKSKSTVTSFKKHNCISTSYLNELALHDVYRATRNAKARMRQVPIYYIFSSAVYALCLGTQFKCLCGYEKQHKIISGYGFPAKTAHKVSPIISFN